MIESDPMVAEMKQIVGEDCYGPVPDKMIDSAEEELGLRFPKSYRVFLRNFGATYIGNDLILGISDTRDTNPDQPPTWLNVVDQTMGLRSHDHGWDLPHQLVYITNNGGDIYYFLDTSRFDAEGDCPVVALGDVKNPGEPISDSFFLFMQKLYAEHLAYLEWKSKQPPTKPRGFDAVISIDELLKRKF